MTDTEETVDYGYSEAQGPTSSNPAESTSGYMDIDATGAGGGGGDDFGEDDFDGAYAEINDVAETGDSSGYMDVTGEHETYAEVSDDEDV